MNEPKQYPVVLYMRVGSTDGSNLLLLQVDFLRRPSCVVYWPI